MFPVELLSMLGGSAVGAIFKIIGMMMENKRKQNEMMMSRFHTEEESKRVAMEGPKEGKRGFQWTRRVIALSTVFSVIVLPKLAALFGADAQVIYAWQENVNGAFWGFFPAYTVQHWTQVNGILITPLDIHATMMILGMYFGGSLVGHNK